MNVLISGAGIAGPTLAFWFEKYGFAPTLVETAPALRASGYVIDFWGLGYDIAEKMGLLPDIARIGYHMQELRIVDDCGQRLSGFGIQVFRELTGGRYITLGRSDLSKLIYDRISGSCEIIFGDSITSLRETHARCVWNSSMAVNGASIWSSAPTGFIPGSANSSLEPKTATRRTWAIGSRHSKPRDIGRATSSSTSSTARPDGRWAVSLSTTIARCSCSYSPAGATRRRMVSRSKRKSCAKRSRATAGSCPESSRRSMPAMTSTSIVSVKSAWRLGHAVA